MKFLNYVTCITYVLLAFSNNQSEAVIEDVIDILHLAKGVVFGVLEAWEFVDASHAHESIELPLLREKEKRVLKRLNKLQMQIRATEQQHVHTAQWTIDSIRDEMHASIDLKLAMNQLNVIENSIEARSKTLERYAKDRALLENSTLIRFAEWTTKPGENSVQHMMDTLHLIAVGSKDRRGSNKSLLSMVAKSLMEAREQVCVTQQSAQQFLYSLYSDIALTELKGYTMIQFSWMILRIYEIGNFTHEANIMRNSFYERIEETQSLLRNVMHRADRTVWRCDPNVHVKGETYDEVTRLLQGFVENEVDMNTDGTCRENCAYYSITQSHGCFKDMFCSKQPRCSGKLLQCQYVDSDMWICPSNRNSLRRYEYIEYEDGRILGKKEYCARGTTKVDSWWRWLFWHCSYCFCLCDESGIKSDRYFNLRESVSDIQNNMIVTGIRFTKHNRIFHLQIQQGRLGKNGVIDPSTVEWKPVDDYRIFDRDITLGKDYHALAWDRREIDLDDLSANGTSEVVTGVRFKLLGTHLNFEIRITEFDFEQGTLLEADTTSIWISNDNSVYSDHKRTINKLNKPDVSTKSIAKSTFKSKHNQYMEFTNTDMDKDAAQTTVPFIDIQEVVSQPPVPLSGVGIYHKGRDGYGGFIAPKIITFDFTPYVKTPNARRK